MAALTPAGQRRVLARTIRRWNSDLNRPQINETMALALISGLDGFMETNAAAINSAIPANSDGRPLRAAPTLTNKWKARFLVEVIEERFEETP